MMTQPERAPVALNLDPMPQAKRWRFYAERTGWWGLGIAYIPENSDAHIALGPWVVGVEYAEPNR